MVELLSAGWWDGVAGVIALLPIVIPLILLLFKHSKQYALPAFFGSITGSVFGGFLAWLISNYFIGQQGSISLLVTESAYVYMLSIFTALTIMLYYFVFRRFTFLISCILILSIISSAITNSNLDFNSSNVIEQIAVTMRDLSLSNTSTAFWTSIIFGATAGIVSEISKKIDGLNRWRKKKFQFLFNKLNYMDYILVPNSIEREEFTVIIKESGSTISINGIISLEIFIDKVAPYKLGNLLLRKARSYIKPEHIKALPDTIATIGGSPSFAKFIVNNIEARYPEALPKITKYLSTNHPTFFKKLIDNLGENHPDILPSIIITVEAEKATSHPSTITDDKSDAKDKFKRQE